MIYKAQEITQTEQMMPALAEFQVSEAWQTGTE
jgi:hypothetical protein